MLGQPVHKGFKEIEANKVLKIKIASPNKDLYMLIMTCTSVADIVSVINQMQAMNCYQAQGQTISSAHKS